MIGTIYLNAMWMYVDRYKWCEHGCAYVDARRDRETYTC